MHPHGFGRLADIAIVTVKYSLNIGVFQFFFGKGQIDALVDKQTHKTS